LKKSASTMAIDPLPLSDLAIPPGETLLELLEFIGLSQAELARRMGRPPQVISEIIHGKKGITAETALQLEDVLGTPAYVWLGLEADYQLTLARTLRKHRSPESASAKARRKAA
jgi:HTH-type transcriptional regulator/antitoxin HigA